ncbi:MAG: hypothetical protein MZV70_55670 [Desulfobacterales bacterium]|nr:hypothetical protein [Desulfobacterales bacterium]
MMKSSHRLGCSCTRLRCLLAIAVRRDRPWPGREPRVRRGRSRGRAPAEPGRPRTTAGSSSPSASPG